MQHWGPQACEPLLFERIVKPFFNIGAPDPVVVAKAEAAFHKEAKVLDAHLEGRRALVGDEVTLADYSVAPYLVYAKGCGMPIADYANVERRFAQISALPSWRPFLPSP